VPLPHWIHRRVIYPTVLALRGELEVYPALKRLRQMSAWSSIAIRDHQVAKLAAALAYAYDHCPLYREIWPADPRAAPDPVRFLKQLPLVDKSTLQHRRVELHADPRPRRVTAKTTGGSTGQAVTVLKDRRALGHEMAASWLAYGWFGVRIGDRGVRFWGQPRSLSRRLRFAAADLAMNRVRLSAFAFDEQDLERYWARCQAWEPDFFYGYVSMLTAFAAFLRRRGYAGTTLHLKVIICTSEALEEPQRLLLSEVFGCPVQNEYGCGEVGPIASSCHAGKLHVMADNVFLEVLTPDQRDASPNETGELVLTDLNNRAMPLVRYRVGDSAVPASGCPCGLPFPVLERVWGRAYDFVLAPDGRRFHGEFFMYLFEELRERDLGLDQFRVTQTDATTLAVDVVSQTEVGPRQVTYIRKRILEGISGMDVTVRRVAAIPRTPSGKTRVIVNRLLEGGARRGTGT